MDKGAPMQRCGGSFVDYGGNGAGREWKAQWFGVRPG